MNKLHTTVIAALLAGAVVLGGLAVLRTTGLGASAQQTNNAAVATKTQQLAAYQRSLEQALTAKTPALPKVPATGGSTVAPAQAQQRVVYHRPPPIVVVKHTQHADDGSEAAGGGQGDD